MDTKKRKPRKKKYGEWTFEDENVKALREFLRKSKMERRHVGWTNEARRRQAR